jgi:hypothetical protein
VVARGRSRRDEVQEDDEMSCQPIGNLVQCEHLFTSPKNGIRYCSEEEVVRSHGCKPYCRQFSDLQGYNCPKGRKVKRTLEDFIEVA